MRLFHYAGEEFQLEQRFYPISESSLDNKPAGLWVDATIESDDLSWKELADAYDIGGMDVKYEVELTLSAKILILSSRLDMEIFVSKYGFSKERICSREEKLAWNLDLLLKLPSYIILPTYNRRKRHEEFPNEWIPMDCDYELVIHWEKIKREYQGILIAPILRECYGIEKYYWYQDWDIASGCIWDLDAIRLIKRV